MPNSGRYPCGNCNYVAASRRMLSRHTAIAHAAQAFKCPLCPFVSCYQANLYRHKRDIHGLGRLTACEICGFFSSSIEDLIEHKENNHQDQIEWLKKKYANERVRLGVEVREETDVKNTDGENLSIEKETETVKSDEKSSDDHENIEDITLEEQNVDEEFNKLNDACNEVKSGQLGPIKIRRSYTCEECGLTTIDPREYLYHRRDVHGEKMTVHECKYCIYASRHVQKLQRHCALVHRQQIQIKKNKANKNAEMVDSAKESSDVVSKVIDEYDGNWKCIATDEAAKLQVNAVATEKQLTARKTMPIKLMKCSECPFQAYNSRHLLEHEKDIHKRKKGYECVQCGYGTNNKSRFTRHLKYHALPKLKCNFCDFKTPYKWNMDRHLRNHVENGEYECTKCSFKTHTKQSLTVHLDYHHGNAAFNSKAKRPRLQSSRKQKLEDNEVFDEFYSNNVAFNDYVDDEEDNGGDADLLDDDVESTVIEESTSQNNSYLFYPTPEVNTQKHSSNECSKQHSCPICDAKFSQLSWLGQHLKEGHPENADASNIAAVVDMLSPQKRKIKESSASTSFPGPFTTSKKNQLENKDTSVPTCKTCGYKTRWVSELLKHDRVHSGEKPFECHICEYKCKWKGDLTRHLQKFHKKRQQIISEISRSAEEDGTLVISDHKQVCCIDGPSSADCSSATSVSFNNDQDSPLDLTVTKKLPELVLLPALLGNVDKSVNNFHFTKEKSKIINKQNSFSLKRKLNEYTVINELPAKIIKKYKCTFCGFMTRTASRFHVHMVQHFDKRPFVCSACGYRSNWQWDITKHIKMKSARDDSHINATLVITDQTGEKNYEKYKSYLVDVEENKEAKRAVRISNRAEKLHHNADKNYYEEDYNSCSDMTSIIEEPENIIVTPDLPFSFEDPNQSRPALTSANDELVLESYQSRPVLNNAVENEAAFERYKLFHCKHCSYKHREKKVVVSHLAVHAGIKLFCCRVCGVSSNWKNVILRHVKTHHSGQLTYVEELITYSVEGHVVCLTGIKKQQEGINSSPVSTPRKDSTRRCTICPYTCLKENHFQFHMKQHQPREGTCFKCMFCPYYVKFRKTLIRHLELHKNESREGTESAQYEEDRNTDQAELFMNENCDNELSVDAQNQYTNSDNWFYGEKQMNSRDSLCFREKRHSCEQCPYKTDNKTQYLYHKQFHRPNKAAKFKCKLCSYWATHHHLIAQHLKVHNTDQPLSVVGIGGQSNGFIQSSQEIEDNQSVEIPVDDDENKQIQSVVVKKGEFYFRMFKCNYCPMMNKRRANVRVHEKMHSKSKVSKYVCPLCNYKCNNQGIITAHMKIHGNTSENFVPAINYETLTTENSTNDANQPLPLKRKRVFSYFCMKCPAVFKSTADMEIHKTFHGMSYPLPCPSCDYRAKNKAHLHKHLLVHTPEYVAKREASYGPPVITTLPEASCIVKSSESNQMLLLEDAEMKAVMEGSVVQSLQKLHRCTLCPVAFFKATTLQYHLSLHGSNGEHVCSYCSYAVDKNENLIDHERFHMSPLKLVKPKAPTVFFSCPKCPAIFDKVNRYNKHLQLHGQKNKHTCDHCDYSVRLPANLFNHKIVHTKSYAERKHDLTGNLVLQDTNSLGVALSLESKNLDDAQKKRSFVCDRCPYFYMRKDAVQRHQRRHNSGGGEGCPYCDYNSLQLSFLRDHVRVHFQSESPFQAQAFMKHEEYEIWSVEDGKREMLFKDNGTRILKDNRFLPPLDKELEDLYLVEDDEPTNFSSLECKETDDVQNKNVPVFSPLLAAELGQLSALQGISESSSHQPASNSDEKNDLIEDALNQSKKLEVILTDVFYGGNKTVIMNAINNETVIGSPDTEQDVSLEERNFIPEETNQTPQTLIKVENVSVEIEAETKPFAVEDRNHHSGETEVSQTDLQCEMTSSDEPMPPHNNEINIYVIKSRSNSPIFNEEYGISCENYYTTKGKPFPGTNSSSFDADIAENEKLEFSVRNDYFDTRETEFVNEEKTSIPVTDSAATEMEWKTEDCSQDIITDVMISDGCDNVTDPDVEVTIASDELLTENISENVFLDTSTLIKCHRNGLTSESDSNVLQDS